MCLIDLAKFLLGQSRLEECVTLLEESATILRTLAAADPENAQAMRDTCLALNVLAHAYAAVGEHERILEIGLEYRDRALQLVEHDPEIFDHRVDLVGARLAFGRAQSIDGRHKLALDEFLAAQRELEQLVELRPGDSNTLRNLAVVDSEIGMLYTRQAEHAAGPEHRLMLLELAQASFQSGLEVLLGLRDEGRLAPSDDRYVKDARDRIERCSSEIAVLLAGDS